MGFSSADANHNKAVGDELAAVLPQDAQPWYKQSHLLKLNFCIISLVMYCKSSSFPPFPRGSTRDQSFLQS